MRTVKTFSYSILIIFLKLSQSFAQVPPPALQPSNENKILIDSIIKVSRYEDYFNDICKKNIYIELAYGRKLSESERKEIAHKINFQSFSHTIYNSYATLTRQELLDIIEFFTKVKKYSSEINFVFTNEMVEGNLDNYIRSILKK